MGIAPPPFPPGLSTLDSEKIVSHLNDTVERLLARGETDLHAFFLDAAIQLSEQGPKRSEGGPFGAVIVKQDEEGHPYVIGIGANHVLPEKGDQDPTAHAEVTAIRDAVARETRTTGTYDLKETTLYTSCECCPMCLGAAYGVGMQGGIYYANTREQAASIAGFADEAQYQLAASPLEAHATAIAQFTLGQQAQLRAMLADADAMLVSPMGEVAVRVYSGQADTASPLALPGMEAVREAAREHGIDLSGYTLVLKHAPSLTTAIAADWAKIGREWNPEQPLENIEYKNPKAVIYLKPEMESIRVPQKGGLAVLHEPLDVYREVTLPPGERKISTVHVQSERAVKAFESWRDATQLDSWKRY